MKYGINKQGLFDNFRAWDDFLKRKIHLIACGGTALTLIGIKESTKDIDLIIPDLTEYDYLIKILKQLGYKLISGSGWAREDGFIFDLFCGNMIHTTQLLESPLENTNHILVEEFNHIYLGVLNFYDIIISKLFRASAVDIDDCLLLVRKKARDIKLELLISRFKKTASFDISEDKVNKHLEYFLKILEKEGLYGRR